VAQKIGLKVGRFIIATNENDILARAFNEGEYIPSPVKMTPSPAMDIQVSSNFERYLFDCFGRDDDKMADVIFALNNGKGLTLGGSPFKASSELILAEGVSNEETFKTIEYIWHEYGEVVDPHTAVGLSAYRKHEDLSGTNVAFATAHPSKFSPIVVEAIGFEPEVPGCLSGILDKEEQYETVPNDYSKLIEYVLKVKSG
jgi:threonine synthase